MSSAWSVLSFGTRPPEISPSVSARAGFKAGVWLLLFLGARLKSQLPLRTEGTTTLGARSTQIRTHIHTAGAGDEYWGCPRTKIDCGERGGVQLQVRTDTPTPTLVPPHY